MAHRTKNGRCSYSTFSFVHILLVFISASLARDITDDVVFPDPYNSSFPLAYQNSTSALGNWRRTTRWRTTDPGPTTPATATTLHDEQRRLLSDAAQVPVVGSRGDGAVSVATNRSPQSGDVAQQSWTIRPRPRTAVDMRDAVTTAGSKWTSRMLPAGSDIPMELGTQRKTSEVVMTITKDGEETLPDSLSHTTVASDLKHTKTSHDKQEDGTDYVSDYNDHDENDDEDDDGDDDDEDDEDYDDYDDDEDDDDDKSDFYNYDEDYEENDNRRHLDSDGYEGGEYRDGDSEGASVHQYGNGDGSMRKSFNYTDISDPGSRDIRRLVINGKSSSHIDVSLLVIYAWLGLVVIMIAITILIFKYKQQLSARCLKVTSSCRKVRQVIGIEEGNNLLAHPLV